MRLLKLAFISAIAFFLLLTGLTLFIPSHIRISRAVDIMAEKEKVIPYLNDLPKWNSWNAFVQDSSGPFSIHLTSITDTLITSSWKAGQKEFTSGLAIYETRPGTITVQWYFDFNLPWYPWEKLGSIVYDKQLGGVMQESLVKLKDRIESNP